MTVIIATGRLVLRFDPVIQKAFRQWRKIMNFVQLQYFHAVCQYQSVSAAAEFLHISQPSLSAAIRELEKEFGVMLFRRHHRGMALTPEGEAFYRMTGELLARTEQVAQSMHDLGNERRVLRLGVPPMIGSLLLPWILGEFVEKQTGIRLEITEGGHRELYRRLEENELDMALLPHKQPFGKEWNATEVAQFEIVCCMASGQQLLHREEIQPEDLKEIPLVLFADGFFQTEEIRRWFARGQVEPHILMQTSQLSTMQSLIRSGVAAGFLFRSLMQNTPKLICVPTKDPISVSVSLVYRKKAYVSEAMKQFQEFIKACDIDWR